MTLHSHWRGERVELPDFFMVSWQYPKHACIGANVTTQLFG